ncbi:Bug family tripartite tricarboxylate transporter substrate binding protein [Bordetella bronchialis]|uniref:LacI family transcriptional regulator n=1 Tax=Bordetella bronchialis TaxID=463025 RepID=A0A193G351_9BORD|nr:tripartite tricarboxylate transporter substrate binding protein [Bordetella bronchialis]ANN73644.1 LacI family transcriptional regulator [Bordetella bronchialis]
MISARFRTPAWLLAATLAVASIAPLGAAQAQASYPDKPIRMIVPFPPGGAVDILGRLVAQHIGQQMNQSIVVENRSGANGSVGNEAAAKAAPDGYTILLGANGLATNVALYPKRPFSELKSLTPIAYVGSSPLIMMVPADSPAKSLKDIVDTAKADPGKISYASAGPGSSAHLGSELLKYVTKTNMLHVPYKGGAPAIVDLTAGRVNFMLLDPVQGLSQLQSGRLRGLVVASKDRLALLPDVPSAAEAGFPDFEASVWWGFMAPKGTPPGIVNRLNAEINKALTSPDARKVLAGMGVTTRPGTPEDFAKYLDAEAAKWATVIKSANITAD